MNATLPESVSGTMPPAGLIRHLVELDHESDKRLTLEPGHKREGLAWLQRVLVDYDALKRHVELLQQLYDSPFRFPRPRRDCWSAEQLEPTIPEDNRFPRTHRLDDAQVLRVVEEGIEALDDHQLASLMLNPYALFDLFDVITELYPDQWTAVMNQVGSAQMAVPRPASPARPWRVSGIWAVAASILIAVVGLGMGYFLGGGGRLDDGTQLAEVSVSASLIDGSPRGSDPSVKELVLRSNLDGFASVVALSEDVRPLVWPMLGEELIAVQSGVESSPRTLPAFVAEADRFLVVITETPSTTVISAALAEQSFGPADIAQVETYLRAELEAKNYRRMAFTELTPD